MASFCSFLVISSLSLLFTLGPLLAQGSPLTAHVSAISAAPASSEEEEAPILSPYIEPLFPTPSGVASSPSQSSLPTIPSSPSPPNPQVLDTPGSALAFPPLAPMPTPSQASSSRSLISVSYLPLLVIFLMQLRFV